jgi:hypothetical protein
MIDSVHLLRGGAVLRRGGSSSVSLVSACDQRRRGSSAAESLRMWHLCFILADCVVDQILGGIALLLLSSVLVYQVMCGQHICLCCLSC